MVTSEPYIQKIYMDPARDGRQFSMESGIPWNVIESDGMVPSRIDKNFAKFQLRDSRTMIQKFHFHSIPFPLHFKINFIL